MKAAVFCLLVLAPVPLLAAPVKVFILTGQSNMEGAGAIVANPKSPGMGKGSLEWMVTDPAQKSRYGHLSKGGDWVERDDVFIRYGERHGNLRPGYGARQSTIGPELGFGFVVGDALESPVLLIKTAWGGKSLVKDFRPPSSGGETGEFYTKMLAEVETALAELKTTFPQLAKDGHEIAGLAWHQGWNDGLTKEAVAEYERNLDHFIRDLRVAWRRPDLPVVIAVSGFGGRNQKIDRRLGIIAAQHAVAKLPKYVGTVASVETRDFFRPPEESPSRQGYHWNGNAETYYLIGEAMGKAMLELLKGKK